MESQGSDRRDFHFGEVGEPQAILPHQFFSEPAIEGERRLMVAVLEDAVHCFQKYALATDSRSKELFLQAEEWFMEPDSGATLTFEFICEARGLDADSIRARLRRWRERQIARSPRQQSPGPQPTLCVERHNDPARWALKKASGE
jgi:hypothetical protein